MFSSHERCIYRNNQLIDVICQLRFPEILKISAEAPAMFQDAIRKEFPQYAAKRELAAPVIRGTSGNMQLENRSAITNHQFTSADNNWRINLTQRFISLSCRQYVSWESFAQKLDKPLAAFIKIYAPAYFERVGLRYLNVFSKSRLDIEDVPFKDMFHPRYTGILTDPEIQESDITQCSIDSEFRIRGGCKAKIHAGPGRIKRNGVNDSEVKFIFDFDLYMAGNIPVNYSAGALQTLHSQAFPIFRGAITDTLHEALIPEII